MKKFFGLMVFLVGFSSSVFAEGWQEPTLPLNIAIEGEDDGSRIYLRSENSKNPDNCKDWAYARIYGNTTKGKYMVSTLLFAKATGKKVNLYLKGCDEGGRPVITAVNVNP